jgi:cell fate (sporulation/competence/biofilm development) regulator YlbF (YheA/YmcA/DUF963 family)
MTVEARAQVPVLQDARSLAQTLRATHAIQAYLEAEERFRTSPEVERLRSALNESYRIYEQAESAGQATVEHIQDVRRRQAELQAHPAVAEFIERRDAAGLFLQRINQEISALLGLDFGATAGPAGGAC